MPRAEEIKITVLSRTIKTDKMPDIPSFVEAMKEMGAKVTHQKDGKIVIDLSHLGDKDSAQRSHERC